MKITYIKMLFALVIVIGLSACGNDNANGGNATKNDDTISSMTTDKPSNASPHTQPIKAQDAKYNQEAPKGGQNSLPNGDFVPNTDNVANKPPQNQQQPAQQQNQNHALSKFESDVVTLTNKERIQAGVGKLAVDFNLSNVARIKAKDMQQKGYFSHTSPTYGSPFDMMRDFGITYQAAGENIARGQQTPEKVVRAWMNSEGHRANILNPNFTHIGVGYDPVGQNWSQMFIKK